MTDWLGGLGDAFSSVRSKMSDLVGNSPALVGALGTGDTPQLTAPQAAVNAATYTDLNSPLEKAMAQNAATNALARELAMGTAGAQPTSSIPQPSTNTYSDPNNLRSILDYLFTHSYTPNPLNSFFNLAYHVRLFVTTDLDIYAQAGQPSDIKAFHTAIDNQGTVKSIVIAESGLTTYNIRELTVNSLCAPNGQTKNTMATRFELTIFEPMGVGFLDALKIASDALGVRNRAKCPYYLEVSFKGYDENGNFVKNPLEGQKYANGGRWIWPIYIVDIQTTADHTGTTYRLTCMPFQETALDNDTLYFKEAMSAEGGTVGEILDNIASKLTQQWLDRYGTKLVQFGFKTFPFDGQIPPGANGKNPASFKLIPPDQERNPIRNAPLSKSANGKTTGQFPAGTSLNGALNTIIASTQEAQDLLKDNDNVRATTSQTPTRSNDRRARVSILWEIETDVEIIAPYFDKTTDQYYRKITYHVKPYLSEIPITDAQQKIDAKAPEVQKTIIDNLFKEGFLAKRYDYLYTGLNTEVLRFDIGFNFKWDAVLAKLEGARAGISVAEPAQRADNKAPSQRPGLDDNTVNRMQQYRDAQSKADAASNVQQQTKGQLDQTNAKIQQLQSELATAAPDKKSEINSKITATQGQLADIQERLQDQTQNSDTLRQAAATANNSLQQALLAKQAQISPATLAEELVDQAYSAAQTDASAQQHNVSLRQIDEETNHNIGGGILQQVYRDRSVYGAALEQLYQPLAKQLLNIDLEIRGDPYWLGYSGLEHILTMRQGRAYPGSNEADRGLLDPYRGHHSFLLTFRYPITQGDDFAPVFKNADMFNGVYNVVSVVSTFSEGGFKQNLKATVLPLTNLLTQLGYNTDSNGTGDGSGASNTQPTADNGTNSSNSNSSTSSSPATPNTSHASNSANQGLTLSDSGANALKGSEGLRLTAYQLNGETGGTVGYGHHAGDVVAGTTITKEQADAYFNQDTQGAQAAVKKYVSVPLEQGQYDALVSYAYNKGTGSFKNSTTLALLNQGDAAGAAQALKSDAGTSQYQSAILSRRAKEYNMFVGGSRSTYAGTPPKTGA